MSRYFLELCYDGATFGGFQIQNNVDTIQGAVQAAMKTLYREEIELTGASRTDAGVHALQNFFHFDTQIAITQKQVYNLNAILPNTIVIKAIYQVPETAHCRFDATIRSYIYKMHTQKDPFLEGRSWYYPFPLDLDLLNKATETLLSFTNYESFSKKNTAVNTFECTVTQAFWQVEGPHLYFNIDSNRFLRGMIRGLVGTLLQVGRGQITVEEWMDIVASHNEQRVDFSTPAYGLYLSAIQYPDFLKKID